MLIFSLPIISIVLVESFLVRANANWAAPALISIFILLFRFVNNKRLILVKINFVFNYLLVVFLFGSILVSSNNKVFDRVRGLDDFADELSKIINDKDVVVSDRILYSNISYQIRNNSNRMFMPYQNDATVTNHFQMSSPLDRIQKDGFFLIGNLGDISYLSKKHQGFLIKEFDVPFSSSKLKLYEINFK